MTHPAESITHRTMLKTKSLSLLLAGAALSLGMAATPAPDLPSPGSKAPDITASTWFNHLGKDPNIESLRGKAILLEFWATW